MTGFPWLKLWNEAPTDPKWLAVADIAGSSPSIAWHTFSAVLAYANEQPNRGLSRGSITGFKIEVVAAFCRVGVDEVRRVIQAFRELGLLLGDRVAAWTKRQDEKIPKPPCESTPRMRRWRAKQKGEPNPIFERDNYSCRYCGSARGPLHIDHVFPRSKGGGNEPDNLATCCPTCNASKGDKTLEEWKASGTMPEKLRSTERVRKFRARKTAERAQGSFQFEAHETMVSSVTSVVEEEEDYSEAVASEREPTSPVVQISNYQQEGKDGFRARRSRITPDWQPDNNDRQYAKDKGYDREWVERQGERFRDNHLKKADLFADWHAAWRNWVQRADDFTRSDSSGRSGDNRNGASPLTVALRRLMPAGEARVAS